MQGGLTVRVRPPPGDVGDTELARHAALPGGSFGSRLGGLVEMGSLQRVPNSLTVHFVVTDMAQKIPVAYTGLLPDLFTEGKGVFAPGKLGAADVFHAEQVLPKHLGN